MTDPKRWLDEDGGGTAEERALLASGRDAKMPSALRKRVWLGVAAGVTGIGGSAGAAAGGAIGQGTAAKGTLSLLFSGAAAKTVLAIAVLGGAGIGVTALRSSGRPAAPAGVAHAPAPLPVESREVTGAVGGPRAVVDNTALDDTDTSGTLPEHRPRATNGARGASKSALAPGAPADDVAPPRTEPAPEARAASRLREESAAVVAVRRTLLSGDSAEALRMLDRLRADFPNGALVQEREALTVRALVESGQKEAARKRGEAFLRAFPRSPHAAEVRALLGP